MGQTKITSRERLILSGLRLISENGVAAFSLRAVAADCGLSCAAPYRHFKNKDDLLLAILRYIHDAWHRVQSVIIAEEKDPRRCLTKICIAYIRFLLDNPSFRAIVMSGDRGMPPAQKQLMGKLSERTVQLIHTYVANAGLTEEAAHRKTGLSRALLYGYSFMLSSGELPDNEESFALIERVVSREFDLS